MIWIRLVLCDLVWCIVVYCGVLWCDMMLSEEVVMVMIGDDQWREEVEEERERGKE